MLPSSHNSKSSFGGNTSGTSKTIKSIGIAADSQVAPWMVTKTCVVPLIYALVLLIGVLPIASRYQLIGNPEFPLIIVCNNGSSKLKVA